MSGILGGFEHEAEIVRIREEYSRREAEIPPNLYAWTRPANVFARCQLIRNCVQALVRVEMFPLANRRILDVGCGSGDWLTEFLQWRARRENLAGIDLSACRINVAREQLPGADLRVGDAQSLPWPDGYFDIVTQFTVFTSILSATVKRTIAREIVRVLKPEGAMLWYDFRVNNPTNPNVQGIKVSEVRSLFPNCRVTLKRVTLAPPLSRRLVEVSWVLAMCLERFPFLRTHYLGMIQRQG